MIVNYIGVDLSEIDKHFKKYGNLNALNGVVEVDIDEPTLREWTEFFDKYFFEQSRIFVNTNPMARKPVLASVEIQEVLTERDDRFKILEYDTVPFKNTDEFDDFNRLKDAFLYTITH